MFLFLFLISSMWIYSDKNEISTKFQKVYYFMFGVMCFCLIFFFEIPWTWNGFHMPTTNYIKDNIKIYDNSRIFLYPTDSSVIGIVPMLKKYNIDFYDSRGNSYKSAQSYIELWDLPRLDFLRIQDAIIRNGYKDNYMFVANVESFKHNHEEFLDMLKYNNSNLIFIPYKSLKDVVIYKIIFR